MKRLLLLFTALLFVLGCDWKTKSQLESETDASTSTAPATTGTSGTSGDEVERRAVIPPDVYGRLVEQTLLKRQRDVTVCTLGWSKQFPDRELPVDLVFDLDPNGAVTRVEARVPVEAEKIGRCIEAAIAPTKFPPGGPDQTFRKRMLFNPQDQVVKDSKLKDLLVPPGTDAGTE